MKKGYYYPKTILFAIMLLIIPYVPGCALLQSWNPINRYYVEKSEVVKQIETLNTQHTADLTAKDAQILAQSSKIIASYDVILQEIADKLYGANQGYQLYVKPGRLDMIINNRVTEAQAAIGRPPTYKAMQVENARLKTEMDETKTTLEQLQNTHQTVVAQNTKLVSDNEATKKAMETLKQEKLDMQTKYIADAKILQDKLDKTNNDLEAAQNKELDNKKAEQALKEKLMLWCGVGAVLALVGAIYSPVFKEGLAIIAAALTGAAIAIPFIQGWMVLAGATVIVIGVLVYVLYKHNVLSKANKNMVNAIQDNLDKGATELKSTLSTWNTKYVKNKDGSITEVPDTSVENYIKDVLMDVGRLQTKPTPAPNPTSTPTGIVVAPAVTPTPVVPEPPIV
jgi:archaellum component FlaF (FlaF/FlaG flagellin family)